MGGRGDSRDETALERCTDIFSNSSTTQQMVVHSHQIPRGEKGGTAAEEELRTRYDAEDTYLDWNP
jgi:hypothetical protein